MASRSEQSPSQVPSLESSSLVTEKSAACKVCRQSPAATAIAGSHRCRLRNTMGRLLCLKNPYLINEQPPESLVPPVVDPPVVSPPVVSPPVVEPPDTTF